MNTWPEGMQRPITQQAHIKWNANNHPGTRQLCFVCAEPTGRCEDDTIWSEDGEPLCEMCSTEKEQ